MQRRLVARLGIAAGATVSFDELEAVLWGDEPRPRPATRSPPTSRGCGTWAWPSSTKADGYGLADPTDLAQLDRLAAEARRAQADDPRRAAGLLREALDLWRGGLTADLEPVLAGQVEAARVEELVAGLREDLLALELDLGGDADAVAMARGLTAEQPYRERRWELLMLALYRAGRQAEALDVYAECRRRLVDDLGIEPGPGLRRMQQAVLAQDPALDPPLAHGAPPEHRPRLPGTSTRLIGRSREQDALAEVWARARVVTLVGPPGAGKTRLAVEAARNARRRCGTSPSIRCPWSNRWRQRSSTSWLRPRWRRMRVRA